LSCTEKFWVLLDVESGDVPRTVSDNVIGSIIIRIHFRRANTKCIAVDKGRHWSDIEVGSLGTA